jgi:hypothetical protein
VTASSTRGEGAQGRRRAVRAAALAGLVLAVVLGAATARELALGRAAIAAADAAAARSDWPEVVLQARAAAEAVAPGSPWQPAGFRRLEAVGHDAEARGDDAAALLAYGAMRTAAVETRAPGHADDRWRKVAEEGIARVAASSKDTPKARTDLVVAALHEDGSPSTWRLALLAVSAVATLGALARLALGGTGPGAERAAQGIAAAGFVAYSVIAWMS